MTLWFCMGTAGELIKVYPLMMLAEELGIPWMGVHTGQSGVNYWKQWEDFGFSRDKSVSACTSDTDLTSSGGAMKWFFSSVAVSKRHLIQQLNSGPCQLDPTSDFLFVHGDTLSTLLGATYGKRLDLPIVHVEAGLRSKYLLQPFPEEINRRLTSEMATWHMVPDEIAEHNLLKAGFEDHIVNTGGNTLIDAIRRTLEKPNPTHFTLPESKYVVANLHRHENLSNERRWKRLIEVVLVAQQDHPVHFAMHAPAEAKLNEDRESKNKLLDAGVKLVPRMKFTEFIRLLNGCEYVLSDGGSNQEECYYLGKPCLILRDTTERVEGLGENALLSAFNMQAIREFLKNYLDYRRPPIDLSIQPSRQVFQTLGLIPQPHP